MGHLTVLAPTVEQAFTQAATARDLLCASFEAVQPLAELDRDSP